MSLSTRVLIGLALGVLCGLFFGELVGFLTIVGEAFILLLQMTVLPYVAVSLITGLGSLSAHDAWALAKRAGAVLLVFWGLTLTAVLLIPLAYPDWPSASFFSTNLVEQRSSLDFLDLFIPSNPFHSLAEAIVPSVVVFSMMLGVALIGVDNKRSLLDSLSSVTEALGRITGWIVRLAPYGVFAIVASAAGTMDPADAKGLEVYVAVYIVIAVVLTFWVLPGLVTAFTPLRYRDVIWFNRDALVTAFATGNLFVVLAVLADKTKQLMRAHASKPDEAEALVDVVIPTSFTMPSAGKLMALSFILFAGWVSGYALAVGQYPGFVALGLSSFFGSTLVAIPFLLDTFQIPTDTFQLFVIADNIVGNRFGAMLAATHTLCLAILGTAAMVGVVKIQPRKLLRYVAVTVVLLIVAIGGVRLSFEAIGSEYLGYKNLVAMQPMFAPVEAKVLEAAPDPLPESDLNLRMLDRVRTRGVLRVGFFKNALPYAFRNDKAALVGFDIEMAHLLAGELGVSLELVKVEPEEGVRLLEAGYLDTVMSGVPVTTNGLGHVSFSTSYLDETFAFITRDYRRHEFSSREAVKKAQTLRLAVPASQYYQDKIRRYLPQAELIEVESPRQFFRDDDEGFDALVLTAESGSAWCLIYPQFAVAVPQPDLLKVPLAYPVARGDDQAVEFLSSWVFLKQKDKTIDRLYRHWILGEAAKQRGPRWSVIRDVLGWID
jgi:Na+/H+-dicarboxylate symporter/ABC-type amino acid transport substrate-binding protein